MSLKRCIPGRTDRAGGGGEAGFSLVEILTVILLIGILASLGIPALMGYLRNYQIRAAAEQLAGEIQTARLKAITKNANLGVIVVTISNRTYRYVIEDDLTGPPYTTARQTTAALLADANQVGPLRTLPADVVFLPTGANDSGFRFNYMGAMCDPAGTAEPCPALGSGGTFVTITGGVATFQLQQPSTGLTRTVTVSPGGQVRIS